MLLYLHLPIQNELYYSAIISIRYEYTVISPFQLIEIVVHLMCPRLDEGVV